MAATPQSQAVQNANGLIIAAAQLMQLYNTLIMLNAEWTDDQVANILAEMQTVPLNADGSLSDAPDAMPDRDNPIDPKLGISRAISSAQIGQLKSTLDPIVAYINGNAVAANPGARAILNAAVGG